MQADLTWHKLLLLLPPHQLGRVCRRDGAQQQGENGPPRPEEGQAEEQPRGLFGFSTASGK